MVFAATDLLAEGRTTGQTVRMLFTPYRRKVEEDPAESTGADTERSKGKESVSEGKGSTASPAVEAEGQEEVVQDTDTEPIMKREWFNMVCYGLPNLMVTQIGKF